MAWYTNGIVTDPSGGDILADTGPLSVGGNSLHLILWCDTSVYVDVVQRNATNTADVNTQRIYIGADGTIHMSPLPVTALLNERVIVRNLYGFAGNVQASLMK